MVVQAEVGNSPHLGIFVVLVRVVVLLGHIFDAVVLVGLALGIHHWSVVTAVGVALLLHVALFLAVAAREVGVPGAIGTALASWTSVVPFGWKPVVPSPNSSHSSSPHLLLSEVFPCNGAGILRLEFGLYCCNSLGSFMIELDCLQFSGKLQALS
jgi:hypothetical protein